MSILKMLSYAAGALIDEIVSAETLNNFFGGGFELCYPVDGVIRKLKEITFVFWFIKGYDDKMVHLSAPNLIILQLSYVGQTLIIRRLVPNSKMRNLASGRGAFTMRTSTYAVPSLLGDEPSSPIISDDGNNTNPICSCFILTNERPICARIRIDIGISAIDIVDGSSGKTKWTDLGWRHDYFDCLAHRPGDFSIR
jgi:hypothetical protein